MVYQKLQICCQKDITMTSSRLLWHHKIVKWDHRRFHLQLLFWTKCEDRGFVSLKLIILPVIRFLCEQCEKSSLVHFLRTLLNLENQIFACRLLTEEAQQVLRHIFSTRSRQLGTWRDFLKFWSAFFCVKIILGFEDLKLKVKGSSFSRFLLYIWVNLFNKNALIFTLISNFHQLLIKYDFRILSTIVSKNCFFYIPQWTYVFAKAEHSSAQGITLWWAEQCWQYKTATNSSHLASWFNLAWTNSSIFSDNFSRKFSDLQ